MRVYKNMECLSCTLEATCKLRYRKSLFKSNKTVLSIIYHPKQGLCKFNCSFICTVLKLSSNTCDQEVVTKEHLITDVYLNGFMFSDKIFCLAKIL